MNLTAAVARVEAILRAANVPNGPRVDVFVGEAKAVMDSDGAAHPYLALFPGPGQRDLADATLCGDAGARVWRFQLTAAGGDVERCLRAVQRAHDVLVGVRLDDTTSPVREDGDVGQLLTDRDVTPARTYMPLLLSVEL